MIVRPARGETRQHRHLVTASAWLVVATLIAALGGFVFWLIAAHIVAPSNVGRAAALFTSAQFLNYATGMGLPVAVARYAHTRSRDSHVLLEWAFLYTAATSVVGTAVFFLVAPSSVTRPLLDLGRPWGFVTFASIVTGMSLALLVDMRLMTLRKWGWVCGRALLVATVRLPLLWFHPFSNEAAWLFVLVGGSQALSGVVGAVVLQGRSWSSLFPLPQQMLRAFRYASVNYLGQLAIQAPFYLLPVVVLLRVDPSTNAVFYVDWSIMAVVFLSIQTISQALLAEGGKDGARLHQQVNVTLALSTSFALLSTLVAYVGASLVPTIYGSAYHRATPLLPVIVLAMVPWALTATYLSEVRVKERATATIAISMGFAALIIAPAIVWSTHDAVHGATTAWLYGNAGAACLAFVIARMLRVPGDERRAHEALVPLHWRAGDDWDGDEQRVLAGEAK
jgi:O-antigen/teichoic acid export membrane protein